MVVILEGSSLHTVALWFLAICLIKALCPCGSQCPPSVMDDGGYSAHWDLCSSDSRQFHFLWHVLLNHVQSMEFAIGGVQSSFTVISVMISGTRQLACVWFLSCFLLPLGCFSHSHFGCCVYSFQGKVHFKTFWDHVETSENMQQGSAAKTFQTHCSLEPPPLGVRNKVRHKTHHPAVLLYSIFQKRKTRFNNLNNMLKSSPFGFSVNTIYTL